MIEDPREPFEARIGRRTYQLRVPTVADRAKFKREVHMAGGRQWSRMDLLLSLRAGILKQMPEDTPERAKMLALVDEAIERLREFSERAQAGEFDGMSMEEKVEVTREAMESSTDLEELGRIVAEYYPPLRERQADNATYPSIAGLVATKMFLIGIDGEPINRGLRGIAEADLQRISENDMIGILYEVQARMTASDGEKKDFVKSSGGSADQKTSSTSKPRQKKSPQNQGSSGSKH